MSSPTVLKLGGSVVTDKDAPETVDDERLAALADAVAGHDGPLVVVHGGGSFGHHHASAHGVSRTEGSGDPAAARGIAGAMEDLNRAVVGALADAGAPAVPVHPFSLAARDADGDLSLPAGSVATMLDEGFVPVLHGDVVAHAGEGVTILSGDELVVALAASLGAERVGLCSAVPGVLDADGAVVPRIGAFDEVADALGGSDSTDVTGGMAAKVRELLALDAPAYVFDADAVAEFLAGGEPGTRID
ncbi:isopentenyl phosphate kinase [Halosegnis marinus]|uniref:Isopentenyl phosphate kinase n=1 Tax=Halosegnis marinus TaxID=3034023 RepID=A0ABD5ZS81_9EURY|nr:isopentenyl phosphate kinase [Halosegnis sp. DT85]